MESFPSTAVLTVTSTPLYPFLLLFYVTVSLDHEMCGHLNPWIVHDVFHKESQLGVGLQETTDHVFG